MKLNLCVKKLYILGFVLLLCDHMVFAEPLVSHGKSADTRESRWCRQFLEHRRSIVQKQRECQRLQNNVNSSDQAGRFTNSTDLNCRGFVHQLQQISVALTEKGC